MKIADLLRIPDMLLPIRLERSPFSSIIPRERGFQPTGGHGNGRAFMGNLRRVKKAQRRRAFLRGLRK